MKIFTLKEEIEYLLKNKNKDFDELKKNYSYEKKIFTIFLGYTFPIIIFYLFIFYLILLNTIFSIPDLLFPFIISVVLSGIILESYLEKKFYIKNINPLRFFRKKDKVRRYQNLKKTFNKDKILFNILNKMKAYENKLTIKSLFFNFRSDKKHTIKNICLKDVTKSILYYNYEKRCNIELMKEISDIILDLNIEKNKECEVSETIYEIFNEIHDDIKKANQYKEMLVEYSSKDENKKNTILNQIKNSKEKLNQIINL